MQTRITPSITTKAPVVSIGSQFVISAGVTLNSISAKPIAIANEKMIWPRADLRLDLAVGSASGSCAA